jgi:hypothetical protein
MRHQRRTFPQSERNTVDMGASWVARPKPPLLQRLGVHEQAVEEDGCALCHTEIVARPLSKKSPPALKETGLSVLSVSTATA